MTLKEAITKLRGPVQGFTSVMSAMMSGDIASVNLGQVSESLVGLRAKLDAAQRAQETCQSDAAWWGYNGQISYLSALIALHEAAERVGPDALPDVPDPKFDGITMDDQYEQTRWAKAVLSACETS